MTKDQKGSSEAQENDGIRDATPAVSGSTPPPSTTEQSKSGSQPLARPAPHAVPHAPRFAPRAAQPAVQSAVSKTDESLKNSHTNDKPELPPPGGRHQTLARFGMVLLLACTLGPYIYWLLSAESLADCATQASNLLTELRSHAAGYSLALGPAVVLLVALSFALVNFGLPNAWASSRRTAAVALLALSCIAGVAVLSMGPFSNVPTRQWLYFVPLIPPVLLAYQALLAWQQRPRSLGHFSFNLPRDSMDALRSNGYLDRLDATYAQLQLVFHGLVSPQQLGRPSETQANPLGATYRSSQFFAQYAVPFLLLLLVGFGAMAFALEPSLTINKPWAGPTPDLVLRGLRWGVAGAFVYVLSDFGSRFFRRDLTVGAAVWAIITLVVGPALAVMLAIGWKLESTGSPWQSGVVLFFAGLAPRRVLSVIESTAMQLLKVQAIAAQPKLIPLTNLRGITPEIANRFSEENVSDATILAYADPIRLVQSMPYDLRQVVDWIDQALLAHTLPKHYERLAEAGVTGAIDLAWRWMISTLKVDPISKTITELSSTEAAKDFAALGTNNPQDAELIYAAGSQLFYEEQVCLLWVLYNSFSTTSPSLNGESED